MFPESTNPPAVWLVADSEQGADVLKAAEETLAQFGIGCERAQTAEQAGGWPGMTLREVRAIIVASPDAALPDRCAQETGLATLRVPVAGQGRAGLELLRDERGELPARDGGEPFATMAIGAAGAKNAALFVVAALAVGDAVLRGKWEEFRSQQTDAVLMGPVPSMVE